eukprot:COSAG06_NODE_144_length_22239_cov_2220.906549_2_plen_69_part_00
MHVHIGEELRCRGRPPTELIVVKIDGREGLRHLLTARGGPLCSASTETGQRQPEHPKRSRNPGADFGE